MEKAKALALMIMYLALLASILPVGCSKEEAGRESGSGGEEAVDLAESTTRETGQSASPSEAGGPSTGVRARDATALPRMVDLGKETCIPCKMMAPILEELKREYEGRAVIEVIDLRDRPDAAGHYGIRVMPTQIFFDSNGDEVWRHEGFLSKQAIVEKLEEMGVGPVD
jgi:thioredoxin 1